MFQQEYSVVFIFIVVVVVIWNRITLQNLIECEYRQQPTKTTTTTTIHWDNEFFSFIPKYSPFLSYSYKIYLTIIINQVRRIKIRDVFFVHFILFILFCFVLRMFLLFEWLYGKYNHKSCMSRQFSFPIQKRKRKRFSYSLYSDSDSFILQNS